VIAQIDIPSEGLSTGYYRPLLLMGLIYVVLFLAARVLDGRGDERAAKVDDSAFAVLLLIGGYLVILSLVALASEIALVGDLITIIAVIVVFFTLLVLLLLVVFEIAIRGITRTRKR
jgi:hypothetical protein